MKKFTDMRQCLNLIRRLGYIDKFYFWNPPSRDARWVVESRYHKIVKGELEEHRYSTDEVKRWVKQLAHEYPTIRKGLHA